ncbi:MAG: ABC transporter permease subunit [Solirubrobacterales bacterium]
MSAARAIARRAFADGRTRTLSFALLFALVALVQVVGYRHSFPTLKDRLGFARSFGNDKAVRLFYGVPHDLLTVGGYAAWRVSGVLTIFAAMWGLLATVRALRTEEEAGRQELILAGAVGRRSAYLAALAAIAAGAALLWLAVFAGLFVGGLSAAGSAYLALVTVSPVPVFAGVGALVSQLAPSRRMALEIGTAVLGVALAMRVIADTSSGIGGLRWITPLGWAEEMRAFAGPRPGVLLLPLFAAALLLALAGLISSRRDIGNGLLAGRDSSAPRMGLLSSPTALALRSERGSLLGWLTGIGFFAVVFGLLSNTFSSAHLSASLKQQLHRVGGASLVTPSGALGFYFLMFVLAIGLFACSQVAAVRREEADQRLETLFSLPVSRTRWLAGRLVLAMLGSLALALAAGFLAWAGAASQGVEVSLLDMIDAGANCLPAALLFLALGALAFALVPRASAGIAYGLVSATFLWELFGALLGAPAWTLDISPFHHVGLVPAQPFKAPAAALMLGIAAVAMILALRLFRRRDLVGG